MQVPENESSLNLKVLGTIISHRNPLDRTDLVAVVVSCSIPQLCSASEFQYCTVIGVTDPSQLKLTRKSYVQWYSKTIDIAIAVGRIICFRDLQINRQDGNIQLSGTSLTSNAYLFVSATEYCSLCQCQSQEISLTETEMSSYESLHKWSINLLFKTTLLEQAIYKQITIDKIGNFTKTCNAKVEYDELEPIAEPQDTTKIVRTTDIASQPTDLICMVVETPTKCNNKMRFVVWDGSSNGKCILPSNGICGTHQNISSALHNSMQSVGRINAVPSARLYRDCDSGAEGHLGCVLVIECLNVQQENAVGKLSPGTWIQIRNIDLRSIMGIQLETHGEFMFLSASVAKNTLINVLQGYFADVQTVVWNYHLRIANNRMIENLRRTQKRLRIQTHLFTHISRNRLAIQTAEQNKDKFTPLIVAGKIESDVPMVCCGHIVDWFPKDMNSMVVERCQAQHANIELPQKQLSLTLKIADHSGVVECDIWGRNAELFLHSNVDDWIQNVGNIREKFNTLLINCVEDKRQVVFDLICSANFDNTLCYVTKGHLRWDLVNLHRELGKKYGKRLVLIALSRN